MCRDKACIVPASSPGNRRLRPGARRLKLTSHNWRAALAEEVLAVVAGAAKVNLRGGPNRGSTSSAIAFKPVIDDGAARDFPRPIWVHAAVELR